MGVAEIFSFPEIIKLSLGIESRTILSKMMLSIWWTVENPNLSGGVSLI
jgi:hypothetical protein